MAPDLRKLARRVRDRQDAAVEIYELIEESPPWENAGTGMSAGRDAAKSARATLGISVEEQFAWNDPVGYEALRSWVDAVEGLGVLVMQDGSLGLDALRGFASLHPQVPAILINTKDDPRPRAFTVIHELGHVVNPTASEVWCNEFAGDVLMPTDALRAVVERHASERPAKWVNHVARLFSVTPLAVAVRVARVGLCSGRQEDARDVQACWCRLLHRPGGPQASGRDDLSAPDSGRICRSLAPRRSCFAVVNRAEPGSPRRAVDALWATAALSDCSTLAAVLEYRHGSRAT